MTPARAWPDPSTWPSRSSPRSTPRPPTGSPRTIAERLAPRCLLGCVAESVIGNGREIEGGPALSLWLGRWERPRGAGAVPRGAGTHVGRPEPARPAGRTGRGGRRRLGGAAAGRPVHVPGGPVPEPDEREQPGPARAGRHGQRHARPGAVPAAVQRRGADGRRGRRAAARADRAAVDRVAGLPADRPAHGRHEGGGQHHPGAGRQAAVPAVAAALAGAQPAGPEAVPAGPAHRPRHQRVPRRLPARRLPGAQRAGPGPIERRPGDQRAGARRPDGAVPRPRRGDGRRGFARAVAAGRARPREAAGRGAAVQLQRPRLPAVRPAESRRRARCARRPAKSRLAGFFAQGELGPVGGQNFIHGFTASIALFEE